MESTGLTMVAEAFRTGGVWMYLVLTIAAFTHPGAVVGVIASLFAQQRHRKYVLGLGILGIVSVVGTLLIGAAGYGIGVMETNEAVEHATPENVEKLKELGHRLARYPLNFALLASIVPGLASIVVLVRAISLKSDS